jgi:hypothetical protein
VAAAYFLEVLRLTQEALAGQVVVVLVHLLVITWQLLALTVLQIQVVAVVQEPLVI